MMEYQEFLPSPVPRSFVRCYWQLRGESVGESADPALPDGSPELIFNLGDSFDHLEPDGRTVRQPAAFLVDLVGELTLVFAPKPNRALDLRLTYLPILDNLTTGTDTVQMPHPLWLGVLDIATQRAMTMDENPSLALWQQSARQTIASFISSHARQVQDPQFVTSPFE